MKSLPGGAQGSKERDVNNIGVFEGNLGVVVEVLKVGRKDRNMGVDRGSRLFEELVKVAVGNCSSGSSHVLGKAGSKFRLPA